MYFLAATLRTPRLRSGPHQEAVVGAVEHGPDLGAGALDGARGLFGQRQLLEQGRGGQQRLVADDAGIAGARHQARLLPGGAPPGDGSQATRDLMLHPALLALARRGPGTLTSKFSTYAYTPASSQRMHILRKTCSLNVRSR